MKTTILGVITVGIVVVFAVVVLSINTDDTSTTRLADTRNADLVDAEASEHGALSADELEDAWPVQVTYQTRDIHNPSLDAPERIVQYEFSGADWLNWTDRQVAVDIEERDAGHPRLAICRLSVDGRAYTASDPGDVSCEDAEFSGETGAGFVPNPYIRNDVSRDEAVEDPEALLASEETGDDWQIDYLPSEEVSALASSLGVESDIIIGARVTAEQTCEDIGFVTCDEAAAAQVEERSMELAVIPELGLQVWYQDRFGDTNLYEYVVEDIQLLERYDAPVAE